MPRFFVAVKIVVDCDTADNALYYATEVLSEGIGTIDDYLIEEVGEF
jgi:hypothetical protein